MKKNIRSFFLVFALLTVVLSGCSPASTPVPSTFTPSPIPPTFSTTLTATPTSTPTSTTMPTSTPIEVGPVVGGPSGTEGHPWWNDAVFYEINVCSFYDSNGDGIGDFNGVTEKLDYLKDLGITGIWLMPIHPSFYFPGYTADDLYSVNPKYGTLQDFKRLLAEAHKRGIRIIIDRVVHDTSNHNPWFISAQDPNSPYRQWYIWSNYDQGRDQWGLQAWFKTPSGYYFSEFGKVDSPTLDLKNPAVTAEENKVSQFWLQDAGVDGFRIDNAGGLVPEGRTLNDTPSTHAWLKTFHDFYKSLNPEAFTVGELWKEPASLLATYTQGDQVDTVFEFNIAGAILESVQSGNNASINTALKQAVALIPQQRFDPFITNHDMDREMSVLKGNVGQAKAAASLLLTSPGVPFIFFGEEIGMEGTIKNAAGLSWYWNQNLPMQWSGDKNGGFSANSPWMPVDSSYLSNNVSDELKDANSLLSHYQILISVRNAHPALRIGDLSIVTTSNPGLFASLRVASSETDLVLINLTDKSISTINLSLDKSSLNPGVYSALPILSQEVSGDLNINARGGFNYIPVGEIPAYGTVIIQFNPK
jgi:alpha-amylase